MFKRYSVFLIISILIFGSLLSVHATNDKKKKEESSLSDDAKELMNEYLPAIKEVLQEHVKPVAKSTLQNDKAMRFTFGTAYQFLPTAVRWFVSKEEFVDFCLEHRTSLVAVIDDEPAAGTNSGDSPYCKNNDHLALGTPKDDDDSDDFIIRRNEYVISYNKNRNVCNWVSWNLENGWFGETERYKGGFKTDPMLGADFEKVTTRDYTNSGYDRGHMVRSEERTRNDDENFATFYLTNVIPQTPDLNRGVWLDFEKHCEDLCKKNNKELYVISGGIFKSEKTLNDKGLVYIPDSCFKIVVVMNKDQGLENISRSTQVIAVTMPNISGIRKAKWENYTTTVDQIEFSTGYDFLDALPDEIEEQLEKSKYKSK